MSVIWWYIVLVFGEVTALKKVVIILASVRSVGSVNPFMEEAAWCNGQDVRLWGQTSTIQTLVYHFQAV